MKFFWELSIFPFLAYQKGILKVDQQAKTILLGQTAQMCILS
jgi:hypothetical protein